jgi:hypothetical protein
VHDHLVQEQQQLVLKPVQVLVQVLAQVLVLHVSRVNLQHEYWHRQEYHRGKLFSVSIAYLAQLLPLRVQRAHLDEQELYLH